MLDRFQGMQVLIKVAELESLSAAARALKISPTMVTKHVAAQEGRLGVLLLHRTTRRVTLTEAGRAYLAAAERIVGELEEAEALAKVNQLTARGVLRVNAPVSFGVRKIAPLLAEFSNQHLHVVVELGLNDRVVDLVEEGWDIAIRIGRLAPHGLAARWLAPCQMVLCASPGYLRKHGRPSKVSQLSSHECLGYTLSRHAGSSSWSFGKDGEVTVEISGHLRAGNGDALLAAAIAGQGLTYQPTFILDDAIASGHLEPLELDHPPVDMGGVYAVHAANNRPPAKVRVFSDYLASRLAVA